MSKYKKYFTDNKEMVYYLIRISNKDSDNGSIDTHFPEIDWYLSDEHLADFNHSSDFKINTSNTKIINTFKF